jgi:hypothetical protein
MSVAVALLASVVPLPTTVLSGASDDAAAADSDAVQNRMRAQMRM